MLKWNVSGESFYVADIQTFTLALPHYFKAKSFGSFVRQLNMYHFFKVRGQKQQHEFRHPFFRRDAPENLKYIRRKHVKKMPKGTTSVHAKKSINHSTHMLSTKLTKMEEIVMLMNKQNDDLVNINAQMAEEMQIAQDDLCTKTRVLFDLMGRAVEDPQSVTINNCRRLLDLPNSISAKHTKQQMQEMAKQLCADAITSCSDMSILLMIDNLTNMSQVSSCEGKRDINELSLDSLQNDQKFTELRLCEDMENYMSIYSPKDNFNAKSVAMTPILTHFASPLGKSPSGYRICAESPEHQPLIQAQYMTIDDVRYEVFINNSCEATALNDDNNLFVVPQERI